MCEGFANCPLNAECPRRLCIDPIDLAAACVVEGRVSAIVTQHENEQVSKRYRRNGSRWASSASQE